VKKYIGYLFLFLILISCETNDVIANLGCTDPLATNYDSTATIDNGSCIFPNTIYDIVSNSADHATLKAAVDACSLDGVLSGPGPFTLFAPTDAAFNLLPAGTVTALLNDIPQLTNILKHHVVADSVMSTMLTNGQIVTTLFGTDVTVTINANGVFIDNAQVIVADLVADNGVVHVIDAVLLPNTTAVSEFEISDTYLYSIDMLGKKVNKDIKDQVIFDIYNNKIVKRLNK